MKIGDLRHQIQIYTITTTADGEGGTTNPVYILAATRFANVRQLSEAEALRSGMNMAERNYKITFHRNLNEEFSTTQQIRWNGRLLNITSIVSDEFWFSIDASEQDTYIATPEAAILTEDGLNYLTSEDGISYLQYETTEED